MYQAFLLCRNLLATAAVFSLAFSKPVASKH
jgi:hypothetical protein